MFKLALMLFAASVLCVAQTNAVGAVSTASESAAANTNHLSQAAQRRLAQRAEQTRMSCIEGRRYICGRIMQILPEGLVVDSGYSALLKPPFNQSWVVRGNVIVAKAPGLVEAKKSDAICVGLVFLTNIPKRPSVKAYDYVVIHGYPAGEHAYEPVPGVRKRLRIFSASLERAVSANLAVEGREN